MNPTTEPPLPSLQPPQPPQPHRPSTSCERHPDEHFTGFCPSCLCERLSLLDPNSPAALPSSSSRSSAAAAIKAMFKSNNKPSSSSSSFLPELRRTKSFSASKNEGFAGVFEPQRRSCDVRVRNTLFSLFNQEEKNSCPKRETRRGPEPEISVENPKLSSSSLEGPVIESKEEEKSDPETENRVEEEEEDDYIEVFDAETENVSEEKVQEIVEEEEDKTVEENLKPMKDHIDLDSHTKKPSGRDFKEIAGSFWSAASVFSKKLQKWRQKQKMKKRRNGAGSATLPVEKPISRQFRDTQSEIADYGYGRRSCDTDPRFSLDAARISFDAARMSLDDPRYSFEEPRASWDGHLSGRTFPRMPIMHSVVEDAPVPVLRSDTHIPVEEPINEEETVPGGNAQTRDYYSDSSSKRRRSLDRSSSIRKTAAAVVAEIDEMKAAAASVANSKVSPATTDYFHGPKLVVNDTNSSYSGSLRDDCSEAFDTGFRENGSVVGNGERRGSKKSWRWSKAWSIWGFIYRKGGNKEVDDDDRFSRANGVERSFSQSWQDLRGERNADARGAFSRNVFRSNSTVSWRNSSNFGGNLRKNGVEANGYGRKKRDEFVLDRNRSARYSPNNIDNGLLRFYLTPMRNSWRNGSAKPRPSQAHSIARSMLRLY